MKNTKLKIFVLSLITIVILYFMLKDDFSSIVETLINANNFYIVMLFISVLVGDIFKSISISSIAKKFKDDYDYFKGFKLTLKTNFFNGITPFSLGGQPFQLYSMKKSNNIDYVTGADILFEDFYTYQIALMILAFLFTLLNFIYKFINMDILGTELLIVGLVINTVVALFLIFIPYINTENHKLIKLFTKLLCKFKISKDYDKTYNNLIDKLNEFRVQIKKIRKDPFLLIKAVILNILKLLSTGFAIYFSCIAIGANISLFISLIISIFIVTMASFVPIPGASGGVEYSYTILLILFISEPKIVPSLILWRFATYYLPIITGGIMFAVEDSKNI